MAADTKAPDAGSSAAREETTARREFDEATISADDLDETTARREYTEALAKERELATSGEHPPIKPPKVDEDADLKEMLAPPAHIQEWPEGDRLRVLVVEDDKEAGDKLCQQLITAGHAPLQVGDSEELLSIISMKQPQLVLLRVELTTRSGYLICNQLKQHDELRQVPLILMSSEATEETFRQHRKLATRADDYLVLPFFEQALLKKVARVTDPAAAAEPAGAADAAKGGGFPTWAVLLVALVVAGAAVGVVVFLIR